jgi:hypothetical protein
MKSKIKSIPTTRLRHLTDDEIYLLKAKAAAQLEMRRRIREKAEEIPTGWEDRVRALFPTYVTAPFADRHEALWEWVETIDKEPVKPMGMGGDDR